MAVGANDVPVIRALLQQLVSGYQPSGEVVDWVHLANLRVNLPLLNVPLSRSIMRPSFAVPRASFSQTASD